MFTVSSVRKFFIVLVGVLSLIRVCNAFSTTIYIPGAYSDIDIAHDYYVGLARAALQHTSKEGSVPKLIQTVHMNQARTAIELKKGALDLMWTGASAELESEFRVIKIPLDMGLMGFRRFIILEKDKKRFDEIESLDQLKTLVACQGTHWPDTQILRKAGLDVLDTPVHENLFELLAIGRCDYFPRGLQEGPAEVERWKHTFPDFTVSEKMILHYPFTIYFYTSKDNEALAKRIEAGLEKMIDEGTLLEYMKKHPSTAHLFPLEQYKNATFIELNNPELAENTPVKNSRYWLSRHSLTK
ncbi:transporter substrate-binding domain-containing protein [Alteromonas ponticola]|uniref:Transporter substrate-binding domain-containing protein n=1 Tax=Alteromonas aquimaris TaxID=2998417 RepID=A0ABT3P3N2_9ALTE|nr:hypothetical protein [Alteromonas aquimaris]MCW8107382.1 transporter substrate-binding domain-containing protein [Alteromonas aquimaris]